MLHHLIALKTITKTSIYVLLLQFLQGRSCLRYTKKRRMRMVSCMLPTAERTPLDAIDIFILLYVSTTSYFLLFANHEIYFLGSFSSIKKYTAVISCRAVYSLNLKHGSVNNRLLSVNSIAFSVSLMIHGCFFLPDLDMFIS